jgi:hypothetical protein
VGFRVYLYKWTDTRSNYCNLPLKSFITVSLAQNGVARSLHLYGVMGVIRASRRRGWSMRSDQDRSQPGSRTGGAALVGLRLRLPAVTPSGEARELDNKNPASNLSAHHPVRWWLGGVEEGVVHTSWTSWMPGRGCLNRCVAWVSISKGSSS